MSMSSTPLLLEQRREGLRTGLVALGMEVETALRRSLDALQCGDQALARQVVVADSEINHTRRALEQQALLVLAAYRPAGSDLRMIGASLEMVSELERIADYAADVSRALLRIDVAALPPEILAHCVSLGEASIRMFTAVMDAYAQQADAASARRLAALDDAIDSALNLLIEEVMQRIRSHPEDARLGVTLLAIAHDYERVADRATNVAERIVYIETGATPDLD
jgi:phosphate transport system protein